MKLFEFSRSSASYRVRIALKMKNVDPETISIDIRAGEHRSAPYRALNPLGLVPLVEFDDGVTLSQSVAIMRYLDSVQHQPRLFPSDPVDDARVMEMVLAIACDIHPLNNLRVLRYLENRLEVDSVARNAWYTQWVHEGLAGLETLVDRAGRGPFCYGSHVTAADICLVPQLFNARRFNVPLDDFPLLVQIDERLSNVPEFRDAAPGGA